MSPKFLNGPHKGINVLMYVKTYLYEDRLKN